MVTGAFASALLEAEWVAGLVLITLGIVILRYPFATPQTVQMMGVRSSVRTVRILAAPIAVLGFFLLLRDLI